MSNQEIKYNIKGYIPYQRTYTCASYGIGEDGTADYGKTVKDSIDIVPLSNFLLLFLIYQITFHVVFRFINWIPIINIISGLITSIFDGFWKGVIISMMITLYISAKQGHLHRTKPHSDIIYRPNITLQFEWMNDVVYVINSCYTPDMIICIMNWVDDICTIINNDNNMDSSLLNFTNLYDAIKKYI
jgi:hypothetical protein